MTIDQVQDNIIEDFSSFDDWMDKYALLIELGNSLEPLDEKSKTPENLIQGCQSKVWLDADYNDGIVNFKAERDAGRGKEIILLRIRVRAGHTTNEIINSDRYCIGGVGLKEHLSPTRSNGIHSMVKQMRLYAMAFKAKENM